MEYQHIVGLMDGSGTRVVEYTYDAWGKLISTTGTLATSLGADNPFRYRGYYYDTETGLYYLMARYYDPEVCRFISADVYMTTGQGVLGGNMWAYCGNNPVRRVEVLGQSWEDIWELFGSLFGAGGETVAEKSITKEYNYIVISFEVSDSVSHSEPFGKTDAQIVFFQIIQTESVLTSVSVLMRLKHQLLPMYLVPRTVCLLVLVFRLGLVQRAIVLNWMFHLKIYLLD